MVTIHEATPAELDGWDELVERFDNHHIVHTRAWIEWLKACGHGSPLYLVLEDDGGIVGCLPGLLRSLGPLRIFGSPLPGWQTPSMGPAFDRKRLTTQELVTAAVAHLEQRRGVHHIEMLSSEFDHAAMNALGFRGEPVPTYRAALFPGEEARVFAQFKDSARRNVRRAEKLGLIARFEEDEAFVHEHYDQLQEVFVRGGNSVPFGEHCALELFRHMKAAGRLIAISVYLPDGRTCLASGMFMVAGKELLLWSWTHRTKHRWYRPTELMTWLVIQRALAAGCETFDLMGLGDFKAKFGATVDLSKVRWVRSRNKWLTRARDFAARGYHWQQLIRGHLARPVIFGRGRRAAAVHVDEGGGTPPPIRVLMVTADWPDRASWGGTATFIPRQVEFLRAAGVLVDVFSFWGKKQLSKYGAAWWEVHRRLRRGSYDLVHAQFGQSVLVALPTRLPLVVTFRGDDLEGIMSDTEERFTPLGKLLPLLSRLGARLADATIVVSAHLQRCLPPSVQARVIPSGLDFKRFRPIPQDVARRRLGLPLEGRLVLFVGDPELPRKRYRLARQAVAQLNAALPAELVLGWAKPHTEIPYFMNACDALVFTSLQEGSPNVVKEALACNLPVVSVAVGDVPERLRGIEGCEICADDRGETIAAALERVLRRGGRVAGRAAVQALDERAITEQVIAVYRAALAGANHRPAAPSDTDRATAVVIERDGVHETSSV